MSREDQRPGPTFLGAHLLGFDVDKSGRFKSGGPFGDAQERHVNVQRRPPVVAGRVFRVVVNPDDKSPTGVHPLVVHGVEKTQRILKVIQALHRVDQIHRFVWLPIREHGFHVIALRVNGPCFGDHRRCTVHAAGVLAQVVCGKPTDDPPVAASDVHGCERTAPIVEETVEHDVHAGAVAAFHAFISTDVGPFAEQIRRRA